VAAIPEGLPAIMTITLAIGVQRMAHRHAIIRRLPAVETLGSVTVICSDKTGTLTRNQMTVQSVATTAGLFEVTGVGYDPHGGFLLDDREIVLEDHPILSELTRASLLCNDAVLHKHDNEWVLHGDPTEGALLALAIKAGLDPTFEQETWPRSDVIPFESRHRFMATLHHDHAGHGFAYIKGAPERLLELCTFQRSRGEDTPLDNGYWQQQIDAMARFLEVDPFEIRLKNAVVAGQPTGSDHVLEKGVDGIKQTIIAAQEAFRQVELPSGDDEKKIGFGVASAMKNVGFGHDIPESAGAIVR